MATPTGTAAIIPTQRNGYRLLPTPYLINGRHEHPPPDATPTQTSEDLDNRESRSMFANMPPETLDPVTLSSDIPILALQTPLIAATDLLIFKGCLGRHKVRVLVDGGAKGNFVSDKIRERLGLMTD